jgi:hypothetical protein
MTDKPPSVHETGLHVFTLQPGVLPKQFVGRVPGGQHAEHMFDGEAVTSDGRLAAKDGGVGGDAYKQRVFLSSRHRVVLFFPRAQVSDRALESVGCTAAQLIVSFRKWHVSPAGASPEAIHQASMFGSAADGFQQVCVDFQWSF